MGALARQVREDRQKLETNYRAALRFAEAGIPVLPLRLGFMRKGWAGTEHPDWVPAVPAGTPGSVDPTQLEAWFKSKAQREIGISLPEGLGILCVRDGGALKAVENCYLPLPRTLTFKRPDISSPPVID